MEQSAGPKTNWNLTCVVNLYHEVKNVPISGIKYVTSNGEEISNSIVYKHKHTMQSGFEAASQYGFLFKNWEKV